VSRDEYVIDSGLAYGPGDPVLVRVRHREQAINVSRHGVVSLPVVSVGPGETAIVARIGEASRALCQELLELAAQAPAG